MESRSLGRGGPRVSAVGLGCMGMTFAYEMGVERNDEQSIAVIRQALELGVALIDTADVYSRWYPGNKGGESEAIIGTWLKKNPAKRAKVQIATKCGMVPAEGALKRDHIKWSVDESLKRLNTDYVDLFQSHKDDKATPLEETLSTYGELVKAGKIRALAVTTAKRYLRSRRAIRSVRSMSATAMMLRKNAAR